MDGEWAGERRRLGGEGTSDMAFTSPCVPASIKVASFSEKRTLPASNREKRPLSSPISAPTSFWLAPVFSRSFFTQVTSWRRPSDSKITINPTYTVT